MLRKQKQILLLIVVIICGSIVYLQYHAQQAKHERLAATGRAVPLTARHYRSDGVNYVHYSFTTTTGQKIERDEKCGADFEKYTHATAIYNPADPAEHELSFDFDGYSPRWRIFFFFLIYLPAMVFVMYKAIHFVISMLLSKRYRAYFMRW